MTKRKIDVPFIVFGVLFIGVAAFMFWLVSQKETSMDLLLITMAAADAIFGVVMVIFGIKGSEKKVKEEADEATFEPAFVPVTEKKQEPEESFDDDMQDDDFFGNDDEYVNEDFNDLIIRSKEKVKQAKIAYENAVDRASEAALDLEDAQDDYERSGGSDDATYALSRAKRAAKQADDDARQASKEYKEAKNELKRLEALEN
ncbi:MAG: hypothetical protein J6L81_04500 [Clostridia bacterium]|nr:hypothetical protein [Clostridia bacterium]